MIQSMVRVCDVFQGRVTFYVQVTLHTKPSNSYHKADASDEALVTAILPSHIINQFFVP